MPEPINPESILYYNINDLEKKAAIDGSEQLQVGPLQKITLNDILDISKVHYLTYTVSIQETLLSYNKVRSTGVTVIFLQGTSLMIYTYIKDTFLDEDWSNLSNWARLATYELINSKVDKEAGKGLSANDLTDEILDGINDDHTVLNNLVTTVGNHLQSSIPRIIDVTDLTNISFVHEFESDYPNVMFIDEYGYVVTVSIRYLADKQINVSWNEAKSGKIIIKA